MSKSDSIAGLEGLVDPWILVAVLVAVVGVLILTDRRFW